ncbi:MAG: vitamin K epoxide reductase family protein [Patescibacteria group bacterium]
MDNLLLALLLAPVILGTALSFWIFSGRLRLSRSSKENKGYFGLPCILVTDHSLFRFLGIPVDVWGILYYVIFMASVAGLWMWSEVFWAPIFLLVSGGALFSLYFILLQILAIKKICNPVLAATSFPLIIASVFFLILPFDIIEPIRALSEEFYFLTKIFSVSGLVLASLSFFSFLLFMEDMRISSKEALKLSFISEGIITSALALLALGVAMVFIAEDVNTVQVISFSLSITLVGVICEFVKTVRIRPALVFISLKRNEDKKEEKELLKRLSFGVEGIVITSWIFIAYLFLVISFKEIFVIQIMGLYVLLVMVAFILSQLVSSNILYGNDR